MTEGLPRLVKLHSRKLDERRRKVTGLEAMVESLRADRRALDAEFEREAGVVRGSPEMGLTIAAYLAGIRARRQRLDSTIVEVEREAIREREELTEAFRQLKRFELVQQHREERARTNARQAQRKTEDEQGIATFYRTNKQG